MKESQTFLFRIKSWNNFEYEGKVSSWIPSLFEDNRRFIIGKERKWMASQTKLSPLYSKYATRNYPVHKFHISFASLRAVRINPRTWETYRYRVYDKTTLSFLYSFTINKKFRQMTEIYFFLLRLQKYLRFFLTFYIIFYIIYMHNSDADIQFQIQIDL